MKKSLLFCFIISVLFSCQKDNESPLLGSEFQSLKNVAYGTHEQQTMDVYLPANRSKTTKLILLLHGGGWTTGDKWEMDPFVDTTMMREANIGFVNMNYCLATQKDFKHPAQVQDVDAVLNFLQNKSQEWLFNPDTFGIVGASAGGHLAMLYAYGFDTQKRIHLVGNCVGPMNFWVPEMLQDTACYLSVLGFLGKMHWEDESLWKNASPFYQAKEGAPASLIFLGDQDAIVPVNQGQEMKQKLDGLSIKNGLTIYPGAGHGWWPSSAYFTDTKISCSNG